MSLNDQLPSSESPISGENQGSSKTKSSPPKYDYYNPSTWLVAPEDVEEEAAITDDIFAKLNAQNEKVHVEDAEKVRKAEEEAHELSEEEEQRKGSPVRIKPNSQPNSPMRLPYRKAAMKIFHDEELSDSEGEEETHGSYASHTYGDYKDDGHDKHRHHRHHHNSHHKNEGSVENEDTDAEYRRNAKLEAAKEAMIRHRAKFTTGEDNAVESHEELMEALLNPASIPTPDPPAAVFALGKDGCAAVWWHYDRTAVLPAAWVTEWEVKRYRLDRDGEWRYKGTTMITEPHLIEKNRATVEMLENNTQYCFSIVAVNRRGRGFESVKSEAVMVEASLPPGWFRFWNEEAKSFFYSNIKTRQADWIRPELDDWYLDEGIVLNFNVEERAHLRELFEEEMFHFKRITVQGFKRIMLDVGEVMGKSRIRDYFLAYFGKEQLMTWSDFMYVVSSIKKKAQHRDKGSNCHLMFRYTVMLPCTVWEDCLSAKWTQCNLMMLLGGEDAHERQKIGDWVVEWNAMAERNCYTNSKTHEFTWDTPEEVRFYLPDKMLDTLLGVFTEGDIADFKVRFGHLDLNNSGFIDEHEFKLLLESMEINLTDRSRRRLIREIDINGNGTIEFHEFCFMMLTLQKKKEGVNSIWDQIRVLSNDEAKLQAVTDDMVAVDKWEEEHGDHDKAHNPHFMVRHRKTLQTDKKNKIVNTLNPHHREYSSMYEYDGQEEVTLVGDDGVGGGEGEGEGEGEGDRPVTVTGRPSSSGVYAVNLPTGRPGTSAERPGTHMTVRSVSDLGGLDWGSRPGTTAAYRPGTTGSSMSRPGTHFSHRSAAQLPPGGAPGAQAEMQRDGHGLRDVSGGAASGDDYDPEADSEADSEDSKYIIDKLMARKREEEAQQMDYEKVMEFVKDCGPNSVKLFFKTIDMIDDKIDMVLCKKASGPHGRHCMCGCRKLYPEDVSYPFWTKSKDEPLTWGLVCPCCCDQE